jgi:hypothetical protein
MLKVMIFWNVMQSLADNASISGKKCYEHKEWREWGVSVSETIEMGAK